MKLILACVVGLMSSSALAAQVVTRTVTACRSEADAKKLDLLSGKGGSTDMVGKPSTCLALNKGMSVSVDHKDGGFVCLRPFGSLDCFWAPNFVIGPPPEETRPGSGEGLQPAINGLKPGFRTTF